MFVAVIPFVILFGVVLSGCGTHNDEPSERDVHEGLSPSGAYYYRCLPVYSDYLRQYEKLGLFCGTGGSKPSTIQGLLGEGRACDAWLAMPDRVTNAAQLKKLVQSEECLFKLSYKISSPSIGTQACDVMVLSGEFYLNRSVSFQRRPYGAIQILEGPPECVGVVEPLKDLNLVYGGNYQTWQQSGPS